MTNIEKLGALLNKAYSQGSIPKCCTISDISTLQLCYNELVQGKHPEFIQVSVKNVLENMGFIVAPKGVGYVVII